MIGGFSAFLPIMIKVIQGTQIGTIAELADENYETMKLYSIYSFLGTLIAIVLGFGSLAYHTLVQFRDQKKSQRELNKNSSGSGNSGIKNKSSTEHNSPSASRRSMLPAGESHVIDIHVQA